MAIIEQRNGKPEVTYAGAVLSLWEKNGSWDSDFYANVWDDETQSVKAVNYGTTRFACDSSAHADATAEVRAKAHAYAERRMKEDNERRAALEVQTAQKGRLATVAGVGPRSKKAQFNGMTGEIFWVGRNQYSHEDALCIGVRFQDGTKAFFDDKHITVFGASTTADDAQRKWNAAKLVAGFCYNWLIGWY